MKSGDAFYRIGIQHGAEGMPCQDHALIYSDEDVFFAGVSDGCSSGGKTDIGARIVNMSTIQSIKKSMETEHLYHTSVFVRRERCKMLQGASELLGLSSLDLLATSLYIYSTKSRTYVHVVGDGTVAIVFADGHMEVRRFTWDNNTPYYPAYDMHLKDQFILHHGGDVLGEQFVEEQWQCSSEGVWDLMSTLQHTIIHGMRGHVIDLSQFIEQGQISCVAVFTDGVDLVDGFSWQEIIKRSLAFKQIKGAFVRRRMIKLCKEISVEHKGPMDDLSCAVMYVGRDIT